MRGILGIIALIAITYMMSTHRNKISWGQVLWGLGVQGLFALTILKTDIVGTISLLILLYSSYAYNFNVLLQNKIANINPIFRQVGLLLSYVMLILSLGYIEKSSGMIGIVYQLLIVFIIIYLLLKSCKIKKIQELQLANVLGLIFTVILSGLILGQNITGASIIQGVSKGVTTFLNSNREGGAFVFGNLMTQNGFVFALSIISSTVFFASVMSIFDYLGVTTTVVNAMAHYTSWSMSIFRIKPISGVESLIATANIFLSMQASPLLVKKYLPKVTQSEIVLIIVAGLATIAGGTMAIFINAGVPAEYLLAASVMSTPAAICLSKILCPETEVPETLGSDMSGQIEKSATSILGAASDGIIVGMRSGAMITVMIMGFISLIKLGNTGFAFLDQYIDGYVLPTLFGYEAVKIGDSFKGIIPQSLDKLFGYLGVPMAWLLGTPTQDIVNVGELLGLKVAINEAVAYTKMLDFISQGVLTEKSVAIASYALCGFANVGSLGILIGIMTGIIPERKDDFIKFGIKGMFVGAFASFMTAAFAGIFL